MSTAPAVPLLFNALNGQEVREIILRKVREAFDNDERFRLHHTYPELRYKFSLSMTYAPGMAEAVNVSGNVDARSKIVAMQDVITSLQKQLTDRDEHFRDIEQQAGMLLSDNEKKTRDLADANEFIKKLMAEKHTQPSEVEQPIFDLEALAKGEPIIVEHESEVIDEPDRLRESGETLNPEAIEIEVEGGGEATGEAIPQMAVVGRQPSEVSNLDPSLKLPTAGTGVTVMHGAVPRNVKGRPRE
jgi:hypothetical protein